MGRPRSFDTDEVVDSAMEVFWTYGYGNTSPAQLVEATGLAKGSLYNAFGSKRELFERALARYDRLGLELFTDILTRPGTTRERIGALLRALVDADLAQPIRRGCLVVNTATELAGHDAELMRALGQAEEHTMEVLRERIERGRRDGDVRADIDPRATAEFLTNTIAGLRVLARTQDATTLHRIIDTTLTIL